MLILTIPVPSGDKEILPLAVVEMFNEPTVSNKLPRTVKLPTVILPVAVIDPAVDILPPITLPTADM